MDEKNNEFNNAVLKEVDTVNLCDQPHPPANCAHLLSVAQNDVKSSNSTYQHAKATYNNAAADQAAKQTALQDAETAYITSIKEKDSQIQAAEATIQAAVAAKGVTALAFEAVTRKCVAPLRIILSLFPITFPIILSPFPSFVLQVRSAHEGRAGGGGARWLPLVVR